MTDPKDAGTFCLLEHIKAAEAMDAWQRQRANNGLAERERQRDQAGRALRVLVKAARGAADDLANADTATEVVDALALIAALHPIVVRAANELEALY